MYRLDQQIEGSRRAAIDRLPQKAARSLRLSLIAALVAMALFSLTSFLLLGCLLARVNPFAHPALVLYLLAVLPAIPLLAMACGIFSLRHATLRAMIKEKGPVREY